MNKYELTDAVADLDGQGAWNLPAEPTRGDWERRARLTLMKSPGLTVPGVVTAWLSYMDGLAKHPGFRAQAEDAQVEVQRAWAAAEINELELERKLIDPKVWGLSPAQQVKAKQVSGLAPRPNTGDKAAFDVMRHKAALELETGELSLNGFVDDLRRLERIDARLSELRAKLKSLSTASERESAARKEKIAQAAAERKALAKAEPVTA